MSGEEERHHWLRRLRRMFTCALLAGDELSAETAVGEAVAGGLTAAEVDDELITPAMWFVGERWAAGEISVADEHLATEITLRVLALQREARRTASRRRGRKALLAAPEGELHVVALRMTCDLLEEAGYDVLMLGPNVPTSALAGAALRHGADLVCLTVTMLDPSRTLLGVLDEIRHVRPKAAFLVGGRGVPPMFTDAQGIVLCTMVSDAVGEADALMQHAALN